MIMMYLGIGVILGIIKIVSFASSNYKYYESVSAKKALKEAERLAKKKAKAKKAKKK